MLRVQQCATCFTRDALMTCACDAKVYCSMLCQERNWLEHRSSCQRSIFIRDGGVTVMEELYQRSMESKCARIFSPSIGSIFSLRFNVRDVFSAAVTINPMTSIVEPIDEVCKERGYSVYDVDNVSVTIPQLELLGEEVALIVIHFRNPTQEEIEAGRWRIFNTFIANQGTNLIEELQKREISSGFEHSEGIMIGMNCRQCDNDENGSMSECTCYR